MIKKKETEEVLINMFSIYFIFAKILKEKIKNKKNYKLC